MTGDKIILMLLITVGDATDTSCLASYPVLHWQYC